MLSRPYKLLVVDDDEDACEVISDMIKACFDSSVLTVVTEASSIKARKLLEKGDIKILVTDMNMPYLSGYDLLGDALAYPGCSVIVFTGDMSLSVSLSCFQDGACSILSKPVCSEKMEQVIQGIVARLDDWVAVFHEYREPKARRHS